MRLIIAGSRWIPVGVSLLIADAAIRVHGLRPREIISGMAPGPDTAGRLWGEQNGVYVKKVPALWSQFGKGAGAERNERMAEIGTHLLAIWDGTSTGTQDMIDRAGKHGLWWRVLEVVPSLVTQARMDELRSDIERARRRAANRKSAARKERRAQASLNLAAPGPEA